MDSSLATPYRGALAMGFALCLLPCLSLPAAAQSVLDTFDGPAAGAHFGWTLDDPGDVDRDGIGDLLVGAPWATPEVGKEEAGWLGVISGRSGLVLLEWWGATAGEHFGAIAAGAGDVNGDSVPDVVAKNPLTDRIEVYSGANGALVQSFTAVNPDHTADVVLAGIGDWDGDGFDDVVAGYPSSGWGSGAYHVNRVGIVELYSGFDGALMRFWTGPMAEGFALGFRVCGLGDTDGDGHAEFAVSADPNTFEEVHVYGATQGPPLAVFHSLSTGGLAFFGLDISPAGDVNRDGIGDLWIAAPYYYDPAQQDWVGACQLFSAAGGAPLATIFGHESFGGFGSRVAGGLDVDLDGVPDVLISNGGGGLIEVHSGADSSLLHKFTPGQLGVGQASPLALVGDQDRNGGGELAIGFPNSPAGGTDAGQVVVVAGCDGRWTNYGQGLLGSGGLVPKIAGARCPIPGQTVEVRITNGLGGASGALLIGLSKASVPIFTGTLLVLDPVFLIHTLGGIPGQPGTGSANLPLGVPANPALSGIDVLLQGWYLDPSAPQGISMTRGLKASIG